jgi:peptidoglycan hydrolase-like protein with peptidoglycan-binding domain
MPPPRHRGTLKEEGMTRKLALTAGILFSVLSAGTLTAQTAATTKPSSSSTTMRHSKTSMSKGQDSTSVRSSAATRTHHAAWSTDQVKEAQQGLAKAGFYKGQPTGKYDRATRKAIRDYQKANKLKVTGRLDNELLTKLRSTS